MNRIALALTALLLATPVIADDEYETIGGHVINAFGHLPKRGESVDMAGFNVKILRSDKRRVHLLRLVKLDSEQEKTS